MRRPPRRYLLIELSVTLLCILPLNSKSNSISQYTTRWRRTGIRNLYWLINFLESIKTANYKMRVCLVSPEGPQWYSTSSIIHQLVG